MPGIKYNEIRTPSFTREVEQKLRDRGMKIDVLRDNFGTGLFGFNDDSHNSHLNDGYHYKIKFRTTSGEYIITDFKEIPGSDRNRITLHFTDNSGTRKELDLAKEMNSISERGETLPSLSDFVIGVINANEKTITQSKIKQMTEALQGKRIEFEVNDEKVVYGKRITQIKFQNEAGETFKIRIPGQNGEVSVHQAQSYKGRSGPAIEGLESVSEVIEALNNGRLVPQQSQQESQQESRRPSASARLSGPVLQLGGGKGLEKESQI